MPRRTTIYEAPGVGFCATRVLKHAPLKLFSDLP
jgi:hypothetical protein